jgi:hypothetical protein
MLLLRVHLCSPPWWDARHPDDLLVWDGDRREHDFLHGYRKRTVASWSSRAWRRTAEANLAALLEHARSRPWGRNVAGVLVAAGNTEEWFQVGTMEGLLPDYSTPARDAFRDWLGRKGWSASALAARWGIEASSATAVAPPPARRRTTGSFRDPRADAWAMDFDEFLAEEAASFIGELCGVVRRVSGGDWFAGVFFGYLTEMVFHGDGVLHGGHLGLGRVLRDERVDFLASPGSYARRDLRAGAAQSMLPVRAAVEAGKAVFHENDLRTHVLMDDAGYGWTERPSETESAQEREAGFALAHGAGLWWFDMAGTFYDDPATVEAIGRICRVAASPRPPRESAPIAFVIDEDSLAVTAFWPDRYADVLPRQLLELARVGAAHDVRLLSELPEDHSYRMLVFPNLFRVEPASLARVRKVAARARLSLFVGPVGLAPVASGDPPGPAAVTGLPIEVRAGRSFVEIGIADDELLREPDAPRSFGRRFEHPALVFGKPGAVRVLGRHRGSGEAAFFEGPANASRGAYAADAIVPAAALRLLARQAGVPITLGSGDVVATDGTLVAVTASTAGVRRLHVDGAPAVDVPMSAGQTRLVLTGPRRRG